MKYLLEASLITSLLAAAPLAGCNHTAQGAGIGAGAGGAVGAGIGAAAGGKKGAAIGAIIGAAVGGTTGAVIGHRMDERAEQLAKDLENAQVERVGEGILVTFDSGILFDVDEADLRANAKSNIAELATVLERYDDTDIMVVGHTDATGSDEYNRELSRRRAQSVATFAQAQGIDRSRVRIVGEGETAPVASNNTETGRQQNRRVEVAIFANDRMKEAIEDRQASL